MSPSAVLVEEPVQQVLPGFPAPPAPSPMSPRDELNLLEREVLKKGISNKEFVEICQIGVCDVQVQTRVERLHEWLASR